MGPLGHYSAYFPLEWNAAPEAGGGEGGRGVGGGGEVAAALFSQSGRIFAAARGTGGSRRTRGSGTCSAVTIDCARIGAVQESK